MEVFPYTIDELIDALDAQFPPRNPKPSQDHPQIMYAAGQRSVVEYLRAIQAAEEE